MADVFTTKIVGMTCYPQEAGMTDVVFQVQWSYEGTDGTFTTAMSGSTDVPAPASGDFTPFDQLTEAQVLGWVQECTDPNVWIDCAEKISAWLAAQHKPPVVNPPLPWGTP